MPTRTAGASNTSRSSTGHVAGGGCLSQQRADGITQTQGVRAAMNRIAVMLTK